MSTAASAEPRASAAATLLTPVGRSNTDAFAALDDPRGQARDDAMPLLAAAAPVARDELERGWYVDPIDPGHMRWWDGRTWTADTHPMAPPAAPVRDSIVDLRDAAPAAVAAAAVAAPRVDRRIRPVYFTSWFWLLAMAAVALWLVAWQATSADDVPQAPGISVVPAPSPTAADESGAFDDPLPLPTLTPQPLG